MKKIYAYLRVSTNKQFKGGSGLSAQMDSCLNWAKQKNIEISNVFIEKGISGAMPFDKRPVLIEVLKTIKKEDTILIAKRDRLGRDPIVIAVIEEIIRGKNANIISVAGEGTESNDPTSVFMRRIIDAFSEFERATNQKRTKMAMEAKKSRGERVGHIPFGYKLLNKNLIIESEEEQEVMRYILTLKEQNKSIRNIAKEMNNRKLLNRGGKKWNNSSIHRLLSKK